MSPQPLSGTIWAPASQHTPALYWRRLPSRPSWRVRTIVTGIDYNATLWVLRGQLAMVCFRVQADAGGHVAETSVADFNQLDPKGDFDGTLRTKLLERYGAQTEITVIVDSGAGFEQFRRGSAVPLPSSPPGPSEQKQPGLWDEPSKA
jgi:hypothetical protein